MHIHIYYTLGIRETAAILLFFASQVLMHTTPVTITSRSTKAPKYLTILSCISNTTATKKPVVRSSASRTIPF